MGGSGSGGGLDGVINALLFSLPLDVFYYDLDISNKDLANFREECKKLCGNNKFFKNIRLCSILLRFLKSTNRTSDKKASDYDNCKLFNYWVYDRLSRSYNYEYNIKVVHEFAEIQRVWNELIQDKLKESYFGKCKPDFDIPTQDDWRQRKKLYDYCVNYELLQGEIKSYEQNCRHYYAYIKSNAPLYEHFKKRCLSADKSKCPEFYDECKDYDPDIVLRDLSCYNDMKKEEATSTEKVLSVESHPGLPTGGTLPSEDLRLKNGISPPLTKAGDILLGVVATTMTSGALYKFTPLGNMLRNRFGWNNNMKNFNGGDNGLFDYASESFNPFSGGAEEHYIGYHPA